MIWVMTILAAIGWWCFAVARSTYYDYAHQAGRQIAELRIENQNLQHQLHEQSRWSSEG